MSPFPTVECVFWSQMDEFRASRERQAGIFSQVIPDTMKGCVSMARDALKGKNIKLFILPGNDDEFAVDEVLRDPGCDYVVNPEGKGVEIDADHEMISTGCCNVTPWHGYTDVSEEELAQKIEAMARHVKNMRRCIFNFHCSPFGTLLDTAPKLDQTLRPISFSGAPEMAPAGSVAVRNAIEKCQPFPGLHGHIHEPRGVEKIGRTMRVNAGSEYGEGSSALPDQYRQGQREDLSVYERVNVCGCLGLRSKISSDRNQGEAGL